MTKYTNTKINECSKDKTKLSLAKKYKKAIMRVVELRGGQFSKTLNDYGIIFFQDLPYKKLTGELSYVMSIERRLIQNSNLLPNSEKISS